MNRDIVKAIFAIVSVLIFIPSLYFVYSSFLSGGAPPAAQNQTSGLAIFNATVEQYEPYIAINSSINSSTVEKISDNKEVEGVASERGGYVVIVKDAENVTSVYRYLQSLGIKAYAIAVLSLPDSMEISTENGSAQIKSGSTPIRYQLEPIFAQGDRLEMKMVAVASNGALISYGGLALLSKSVELNETAVVQSLERATTVFSVPWENRNDVGELGNTTTYKKISYVLFSRDLTAAEMIEKRMLGYVTFINERSATINESFSDKAKLLGDFKLNESEMLFPASTLTVRTEGNESISLPYESRDYYEYSITLPNVKAFTIPALVSNARYAVGEEVKVAITGQETGGKVLITGITPA